MVCPVVMYGCGNESVVQSCLTLCNPMDCSLPGSSVHGILQERILQWVAIPFCRISTWPRDWTWVSHIAGRFFTIWAKGKPVWMWELDNEKDWVPKNWCLPAVVLEKSLESPLGSKIKPVNPKGNQPWIFTGRTGAEAEAPILWSPDAKSWLIGKYSDAMKDLGQEEKGTTEDEMVGWHHWLIGHEFE